MATARDVARRAGTSTAVVSYVFNNGPRGVAPATRQKVLDAAASLGYRPNALARSLSKGRTHSIGLIVPDICNPYFAELARAIEDAAGTTGNLLLIADSALSVDQERRHTHSLIERQVDSVVLISVSEAPDLGEFFEAGIPVVALHPISDRRHASSLTIDYEAAAQRATEHLLAHGYESVTLLNGPGDSTGARQHRAGFDRAIGGAQGVRAGTARSEISRHHAAEVARELLSGPERPRAVYCTTDEQAFGVLYAAHRAGLDVPADLAVVGFDGTRNCLVSIPALTTVQQPTEAMARRVVEILAGRTVEDEPVHEVLGFEFVARESSGGPAPEQRFPR
jgi:LacI family transcriptional regulator